MRLWSLHPVYLDPRGLIALWREGLLARKVLQHQTQSYNNHPQLDRFKATLHPGAAIDFYLHDVFREAVRRGYHFDRSKLGPRQRLSKIPVTEGQLKYELDHLKMKLKLRNIPRYHQILAVKIPKAHPLFKVVSGGMESWERT